MGARLAGMRPDLGPLGERIDKPGLKCLASLEKAAKRGWDFLYVAGADPARNIPQNYGMKPAPNLDFLVVQDLFLTETASKPMSSSYPFIC